MDMLWQSQSPSSITGFTVKLRHCLICQHVRPFGTDTSLWCVSFAFCLSEDPSEPCNCEDEKIRLGSLLEHGLLLSDAVVSSCSTVPCPICAEVWACRIDAAFTAVTTCSTCACLLLCLMHVVDSPWQSPLQLVAVKTVRYPTTAVSILLTCLDCHLILLAGGWAVVATVRFLPKSEATC